MILTFEIKTVSEANQREHWAAKHKRKKQQQKDFTFLWRTYRPKVTLPAVIKFTRFSSHSLDADAVSGAFKHVQDALAREIGVDDADSRIKWLYAQEKINRREIYFTVEVLPSGK